MALTASSILCDVVADNASEFPGRPAVVFPGDALLRKGAGQDEAEVLSYGELAGRAWAIADWLRSRLAPGSRVMLALPTGPEWVTALVGCMAAGMIAVPAPIPDNFANARRRTVGIIRDSGTALVLTAQPNLAAVDACVRESELNAVACSAVPDIGTAGAPPGIRHHRQTRDTLAFLQYTSGSTGEPKGVMVTHGNIAINTDLLRRRTGMDSATVSGGWIPLFHDMGLIALLCLPLLLGSTTVLMQPSAFLRRPLDWLRVVDKYGIYMSAAPNFAYDLCTRTATDEQAAALDLSRWRIAFNGSEPVHAPTLAAFCRKFAVAGFRADALLPAYGMAENTLYISSRLPSEPVRELATDPGSGGTLTGHLTGPSVVSCGIPEETEVRIVDQETGEVLPDTRIGEIWLRGPSVAKGYWQRAAATAATFSAVTADGEANWLRTGDLGALCDGELYITGRLKEMLVIRGRNLFPQDLEQEARDVHPALTGLVGAAFAVAVPDERMVIVHEVNVHAAGGELPRIATAVKARLTQSFAIPARNVVLVRRGAVRRTTSGKVERVATRQLFLDGSLRAVHADVEPAVAGLIRAPELTAAAPAISGAA